MIPRQERIVFPSTRPRPRESTFPERASIFPAWTRQAPSVPPPLPSVALEHVPQADSRAPRDAGTADFSEVRRAFRRAAEALHPDRFARDSDKENATRLFAELSKAYHEMA